MLFKLSLFVSDPHLPVFWSLVLVYVMFGPAAQPPSFTGIFLVGFQFSKGYNKNKPYHMYATERRSLQGGIEGLFMV